MSEDLSKFISTGLRGRCPNCHEGRLFAGYLKFASSCTTCGFDYQNDDIADGPAVFVMFTASLVVVPLALVFQIRVDPPVWLTLAIWLPVVVLLCLGLLRPLRGVMYALQIMNNAQPGMLDDPENED